MNAQTIGQNEPKFTDAALSTERSRISGERDAAQARFDASDRACDARFMRTDCVNAAKLVRRSTMDDLRRQEVGLNDRERRLRAIGGQARLEEKRSTQAEVNRATLERDAKAADLTRRNRIADRSADRAKRSKTDQSQAPQAKIDRAKTVADKTAAQVARSAKSPQLIAEQQAREAKYAQRRADLNQRLSSKSQLPAAPLAVPPPPPTPLPTRTQIVIPQPNAGLPG